MSKLWLLTQNVNNGYDTYDSCVVCADTEDEAKQTSPDEYTVFRNGDWYYVFNDGHWDDEPDVFTTWAPVDQVTVTYLGEADSSVAKGVVCASFNAG